MGGPNCKHWDFEEGEPPDCPWCMASAIRKLAQAALAYVAEVQKRPSSIVVDLDELHAEQRAKCLAKRALEYYPEPDDE